MTETHAAALRGAFTRRAILAFSCAISAQWAPVAAMAAAQPAGELIASYSTYSARPKTITVGQPLPDSNGATAIADGTYPGVFANDAVDPNFGITAPIGLLAQEVSFTKTGARVSGPVSRFDVTGATGIVTSFSSKSELAVHLSTDGTALTLMGYVAPINTIDVSNTNTPDNIDPTNTDTAPPAYRAVMQLNEDGSTSETPADAYSGNNGRGAILARNADGMGNDEYLLTGNAGNGSGTEPTNIVDDTGVQALVPGAGPQSAVIGEQWGTPGSKTGFEFGFSVAQIGAPADKSGKDDNFRGIAVFNNTLYVSKGSGSNGVNTVYQVAPAAGGLPIAGTSATTAINILPGFPTGLAANITETNPATEFYPFGIWFANATTLYVADEGSQDLNADPNAGLQKWIFDGTKWNLAYTIQNGLNLDVPYSVLNYPSQYNPATTGLRHLTGVVNGNSVTLFATTATFSALSDPGADPNQVVEVTDQVDATTLPAGDVFTVVHGPRARAVWRGVEFIPMTAPLRMVKH